MHRTRVVLAAAVAALLIALPAPARAADSHAPRGARADWLPSTEWVMSSWLPYDESRLYGLLGVDRATLFHWLDDRRTLGELARAHGVTDLRAFAAELVATRRVSAAARRALAGRALDTLTQAHLARHLLFHVFHTTAVPAAAPALFGLSPRRFRRLRAAGRSPVAIATGRGIGEPQLLARLDALFVARGRRAVRLGAMSAEQAAALLAEQRADLPNYVRRRFRTSEQQAWFACSLHVY